MKRLLIALLAALAGTSHAGTFDFTDPKGVNTIIFLLDSPLEPIAGWAGGVTGTVKYDPLVPDAIEGKIAVPSKNITFAQPRMTAKLQTEEWLDVAKYPEVSFTIKDIADIKPNPKVKGMVDCSLTGTFSLHGVDKEMKVSAKLSVIEDGASQRGAGKGDLMVLRSKFVIKRGDFGIKPGQVLDKVADEIEVTLAVSGYAK